VAIMPPSQPHVPGFTDITFLRHGRFGDLYRATRASDAKVVELKLLRPDRFKDGEAIRRFQREVRLLLTFEHPYLLRVLDHGNTPSGDPWLALEHREGTLLSEVLAKGPLDVDRVRKIGAQIARVVAAGANRGIVHRGLGPEAILVCAETDDVKVLDFGLATAQFADMDEHVTGVGERVGDPHYFSPEYIESFKSDERSDRYALGVLLYALLTGGPPWSGPVISVLDGHVGEVPPPPSTRRGSIRWWGRCSRSRPTPAPTFPPWRVDS
jgi:eukaryotic-like serine/threonine-protein kinase